MLQEEYLSTAFQSSDFQKIVQAEVEFIKKLGVEFYTDALIGRLFTIEELFEKGFDAIFIGSAPDYPHSSESRENLGGVYSANEFLIRINLMKSYQFPEFDTPISVGKSVAVIAAETLQWTQPMCTEA